MTLFFLAWRDLAQSRARTLLSALAVGLGVGLVVATDLLSSALLSFVNESELVRSFGQGMFEQMALMLRLMGALITLAAGFLVFNAFAMSVTQRRRQIGGLRALGMTRRQVTRLVLAEGGITAVFGLLIGFILGPLLGQGIIRLLQSLDTFLNSFAASRLNPGVFLLAGGLGVGITLFAVWLPARRAANASPLAALRDEATAGGDGATSGHGPWVGALLLGGIILYLAVAPPAEWITAPLDFILVSLFSLVWLAGAGLALPGVVGGYGRAARAFALAFPRLNGAAGRLAAENLRRDRGRVTVTTATLAVAVALVVGMTGLLAFLMDTLMLRSFADLTRRQGWTVMTMDLSQGMAAYADAALITPAQAQALEAAFAERAHIAPFHFVIVPELATFGDAYFSFILNPRVIQATGDTFFSFTQGDWESAGPLLEAGCGLLLPPLIANRHGVGLGDRLLVSGQEGPVACVVAGIGRTFVIAAIIGDSAREQFAAASQPLVMYLTPQTAVDAAQLERELFALGAELGLEVMRVGDYASTMEQAFSQIHLLFRGLLLLAMVTAGLAVVNTTIMNVIMRRQELAVLRAVGAQRRQLRRLIALEAAHTGLIGGGVGAVVGVGFAMLVVLVYGGNSWGFGELALWPTAWQVARATLPVALWGMAAAPLAAVGAAWLTAWRLKSWR